MEVKLLLVGMVVRTAMLCILPNNSQDVIGTIEKHYPQLQFQIQVIFHVLALIMVLSVNYVLCLATIKFYLVNLGPVLES